MAGLLILAAAVAYVGLCWFLAAKSQNIWLRSTVILIAILIPFWDFPIGLMNFYQHCSREGGIHIDKNFRLGDSILFGKGVGIRPEEISKFNFKTVEIPSRDTFIRYTETENGLIKTTDSKSISPIRYESLGWESMRWNLRRIEHVIRQTTDGKIVASRTDFSWGGMWWEQHIGIRGEFWSHCSGVPQKSLLTYLTDLK